MKLEIHKFTFNPLQVNTYVVYCEDGDALIVDPGCYTKSEESVLNNFITKKNLKVKFIANTHSHVDHMLGNNFVYKTYGIAPLIHKSGMLFYSSYEETAKLYGFDVETPVNPAAFIEDGDILTLGNQAIKVEYTPGHADGSVCLIYELGEWIITGDLIFKESIGRTDFPTGNYDILHESVQRTIYSRSDAYAIHPGHGHSTTVGHERVSNPFL